MPAENSFYSNHASGAGAVRLFYNKDETIESARTGTHLSVREVIPKWSAE